MFNSLLTVVDTKSQSEMIVVCNRHTCVLGDFNFWLSLSLSLSLS